MSLLALSKCKKVASEDNIADVLTKPLPWKDFYWKARRLLGIPDEEPLPDEEVANP